MSHHPLLALPLPLPTIGPGKGSYKAVYEVIYQQGGIIVTGTVVEGLYIISVVCANLNTEVKYMELAFDILVNAAEHLFQEGAQAASQQVMVKL